MVGAAQSPPCTICHTTPNGGLGTATKPLAVYLRSRGLVAEDEASLRNALTAAAGERHDTDQDGVIDTDELKAGTDPNGAGADLPPVQYGCGNVSGAQPSSTSLMAMIATALACLARRSREPT